jgi:hypothetical protein
MKSDGWRYLGWIVFNLIFAFCVASAIATEDRCVRNFDRVSAATVRRAGSEYSNCFRRGSRCQPPEEMIRGRLVGGDDKRVVAAIERVWRHTTDTKFGRQCRGVEHVFAAYCSEPPDDPAQITDCVFNEYILPWLSALDELTVDLAGDCRHEFIYQASRAARDYIRWERDTWERLSRRVRRKCPQLPPEDFALDRPSRWRDVCEATLTLVGPLCDEANEAVTPPRATRDGLARLGRGSRHRRRHSSDAAVAVRRKGVALAPSGR